VLAAAGLSGNRWPPVARLGGGAELTKSNRFAEPHRFGGEPNMLAESKPQVEKNCLEFDLSLTRFCGFIR
jgi:hypothetical protein